MNGRARVMSEELAEALTNLVGADIRLRQAALAPPAAGKFEKRAAEWDRAAEAVAQRARAAGLVPEGI